MGRRDENSEAPLEAGTLGSCADVAVRREATPPPPHL